MKKNARFKCIMLTKTQYCGVISKLGQIPSTFESPHISSFTVGHIPAYVTYMHRRTRFYVDYYAPKSLIFIGSDFLTVTKYFFLKFFKCEKASLYI